MVFLKKKLKKKKHFIVFTVFFYVLHLHFRFTFWIYNKKPSKFLVEHCLQYSFG